MARWNPNPRRWDLTIAQERPDSPLGATGGGLVRHHAVPYNRLRDFWNRAVGGNLHDFRGTFLRPFAQAVLDYPVAPNDPEGAAGFLAAVAGALGPVVNGDVVHDDAGPEPAHWNWVAQAYAWMPGNLFLGPLRPNRATDPGRGSDPGEHFDHFASQCMTEGRYALIRAARHAIDIYLATPAAAPDVARGRACRAAGAALAAVAAIDEPTPFDPHDWAGTGTGF